MAMPRRVSFKPNRRRASIAERPSPNAHGARAALERPVRSRSYGQSSTRAVLSQPPSRLNENDTRTWPSGVLAGTECTSQGGKIVSSPSFGATWKGRSKGGVHASAMPDAAPYRSRAWHE